MSLNNKYDQMLEGLKDYSERNNPCVLLTGEIESQLIFYLMKNKIKKEFKVYVPEHPITLTGFGKFIDGALDNFDGPVERLKVPEDSSEPLSSLLKKIDSDQVLYSSTRSADGIFDPFTGWNEKHVWAVIKREFVRRPEIYSCDKVDLNNLDYWDFLEKSLKARKDIQESLEDNTAFLWTGGKEAQVIADMLINQIGDKGKSDIPFALIDTGNQFEEMYNFRDSYLKDKEVTLYEERNEEMLQHIINNDSDPRGYHGAHRGYWKCPKCSNKVQLNRNTLDCDICGQEENLKPIQRQNRSRDKWGVPESCGALKISPMKSIIQGKGFETLLTGRKSGDEVVKTDSGGNLPIIEKRSEPIKHTRINPLANWTTSEVWTYLKLAETPYCVLYDKGYQHTDTKCCTSEENQQVGEYGEGGVDPQKEQAKDKLKEMGYV